MSPASLAFNRISKIDCPFSKTVSHPNNLVVGTYQSPPPYFLPHKANSFSLSRLLAQSMLNLEKLSIIQTLNQNLKMIIKV